MQSLEEGHEEKEAVETKVTLGGKFLDRILSPKSERTYELSAVGQVEAGSNHILWTLRIGQINSQKYYVIRDNSTLFKSCRAEKVVYDWQGL